MQRLTTVKDFIVLGQYSQLELKLIAVNNFADVCKRL